eukprot:364308-Chlamydomonas_euryale.AAC.12
MHWQCRLTSSSTCILSRKLDCRRCTGACGCCTICVHQMAGAWAALPSSALLRWSARAPVPASGLVCSIRAFATSVGAIAGDSGCGRAAPSEGDARAISSLPPALAASAPGPSAMRDEARARCSLVCGDQP